MPGVGSTPSPNLPLPPANLRGKDYGELPYTPRALPPPSITAQLLAKSIEADRLKKKSLTYSQPVDLAPASSLRLDRL